MLADELKAAYNRGKWGIALRGLFGIAIGIIIVARPIASVAALVLVVAIWALLEGIVVIMHAFELRTVVEHWWVMLVAGVVSVLFGIAALYYYPDLSLAFIVAWVAWWLIAAGVIAGYVAVMERKVGVSWGWTMAWGVFAIIAGVLAFMYPGVTLAWLLGLLAAFGIIGGIMRLVVAFRMQSAQSNVRRAMPESLRAH